MKREGSRDTVESLGSIAEAASTRSATDLSPGLPVFSVLIVAGSLRRPRTLDEVSEQPQLTERQRQTSVLCTEVC
jgi:hypothetical protein